MISVYSVVVVPGHITMTLSALLRARVWPLSSMLQPCTLNRLCLWNYNFVALLGKFLIVNLFYCRMSRPESSYGSDPGMFGSDYALTKKRQ